MAALGSPTTTRLHANLTSTTVDTITMAQAPYGIEVMNRSVGEIWVSVNGVTPTINNGGCDVVMASATVVVSADGDSTNTVQILGSGNNYSLKCKSGNF